MPQAETRWIERAGHATARDNPVQFNECVLDFLRRKVRTDDGTVITVHNRVIVDERVTPERYARSVIPLRAPNGEHGWLNRRVFVGTLQSLQPARLAVRISVFELL